MPDSEVFSLPAGTVCRRNGIPFTLLAATLILCKPQHYALIRKEFLPTLLSDQKPQPNEPKAGE